VKLLHRKDERFDYIFLDPPYGKGMVERTLHLLSEVEILKEDGVIVSEHSDRELPRESYGRLILKDQRKYGRTCISFFTSRVS
jgi:16S rRNA G966 N2-methylase RsmD